MRFTTHVLSLTLVAAVALVGCKQRPSGFAGGLQHPLARTTAMDRFAAANSDAAKAAVQRKRAKLESEGPKRFDQPREAQEFFAKQ